MSNGHATKDIFLKIYFLFNAETILEVKFEVSVIDLVRVIGINFNNTLFNEVKNLFRLNRKSGH